MASQTSGRQLGQRRRLLAGAVAALLGLAALATFFAWRQYDDGKRQALKEMNTRVVLASTVFDIYFSGQISLLQSIAASSTVSSGDTAAMSRYFRRVQPPHGKRFTGGLGWIDLYGHPRASNALHPASAVSVSDRGYFRYVLHTHKPFISGGLIARANERQRLVIMAVPTYDRRGRLSGVLAGALLLKPSPTNKRALDLGYQGLEIIDRSGQQLTLRDFAHPSNTSLLALMRHRKTGLLADTRGLEGSGGRAVAYSTSALPGWITVIDRSSSSVFAAARRSLILELASIFGALLLILALLTWVYRRSSRNALVERRRTEITTDLTRALAEADAPAAGADALATALAATHGEALVVVALRDDEARGLTLAAARGKTTPPITGGGSSLLLPASDAYETGEAIQVWGNGNVAERFPDLQHDAGRRVGGLYAAPIVRGSGRRLGAVVLLFDTPSHLTANEQATVGSYIEQAVQALTRTVRQEREHEIAVELQRSLLPEELSSADGLTFATRYHAGGVGVEVGGDWYDVVRRPDGIVHISVGDVAGRGIPAATQMAQLRNAFRAYALDHTSPAEITRRLLRHVPPPGMVTTACLTLDPYTRTYAYALAGHPPILLFDRDGGFVAQLRDAAAPPLGFATSDAIKEQTGTLPPRAVVVAYTDGLVERRGASIDDGISLVSATLTAHAHDTAEQLADGVLGAATANARADDDAALIVLDTGDVPSPLDIQIPADPRVMATVRRRLQAWLTLRGLTASERIDAVLAAHEACINAIEHGYQLGSGTIRLRLDHDGGALRISVEDSGRWRPPTPDPSRGRGIKIMETTMSATRIEHGRNGTKVTLEQRLTMPDKDTAGAPLTG